MLELDRPWSAYALADLEPEHFSLTRWFHSDAGPAIALLYRAFDVPVLVCAGAPRDVDSLLDEVSTAHDSSGLYAVVKPEILPLLKSRYRVREVRPMLRMILTGEPPTTPPREIVRLTRQDLRPLQLLYEDGNGRGEAPDFFIPSMVESGVYCGIREGDRLIAVAGTHIVARSVGVGAIGNVYTRHDRRGKGLSTLVTAAVTRELKALDLRTIVLNVRDSNEPAVRVYEKLGYTVHCNYYEVVATRLS
jgi:ribosomal protein S18 acetylase RimI-like enzyme